MCILDRIDIDIVDRIKEGDGLLHTAEQGSKLGESQEYSLECQVLCVGGSGGDGESKVGISHTPSAF